MSTNNRKVKIKVNASDPSVDPIVVSFPGGASQQKPKFVWRKLRPSAKRGRELVGQDETCRYHAKCNGRGYDGRRTKLYVGLYHKATNTLTLQPTAERGTVFSLEQTVASYAPKIQTEQTTAKETRQALFGDFGSSKKQKVIKSQAANVVNADSVIGSGPAMKKAFLQNQTSESNKQALEQARRGSKVDAVELSYAEARKHLLPSFDADAQEPHLVYSARDMAGDDAWGQVSRVADACLHEGEDDWVAALTSRGGPWHKSAVALLQSLPAEANVKYQIKCAILLNHMVTFYRKQNQKRFLRGSLQEVEQYLKLPMEVGSRFLDLFATVMTDDRGNEGFAFSKQHKDRCLVHVLLLYLMAHGRSMKVGNIKPIADDLLIEVSQASSALKAAGCSVASTGKSGASAALKVPLEFPTPRRGRGRA